MAPAESALEHLAGGMLSAAGGFDVLEPYSELACGFLGALSTALLNDTEARNLPDVMTFAYWCRKSNIRRLKAAFDSPEIRLGLGLVFHVAPSNVPVNFAFSFAFSLLAGNANLVRVPSKATAQVDAICRAMGKLFLDPQFSRIHQTTAIVRFPPGDELTAKFSQLCAARVIWGGDGTIDDIRRHPMPARSIDVAFADRYSICALDCHHVARLTDPDLQDLVRKFYNDTFLMDQNACSSPHLILWVGEAGNVMEAARSRFWEHLFGYVKSHYALSAISALDKLSHICTCALALEDISEVVRHENLIVRIKLDRVPTGIDDYRCHSGFFFEACIDSLDSIAHIVGRKYQTMTYFGIERERLIDFVRNNKLSGMDRIVPIGQALDIGVVWDGLDVVRTLSRIVDIR